MYRHHPQFCDFSRAFFPIAAAALFCGVTSFGQGQIAVTTDAAANVTTTIGGPPGRPFAATRGAGVADYHPSRVLVKFRNGAQQRFLNGSGNVRTFPGMNGLALVENPPGLTVAEAVRNYKADANVEYAEPDYYVHSVATTPLDPLWGQQWDMTKIAANVAWDTQTNASDVVVVVIDTGIDYTRPDLISNLWTDPNNSGVHGYTCIGGACVAGGSDDYGHGTHVAGTIGAAGNNSTGMAGINWQVKLLSMKFLDQNGSGAISDAVVAFQKVLALKQANPATPILTSNSWGGGGYSQALKDAMAAVEALGVVDVCAAGNSGVNADSTPMYPGAYDNRGIISVLATDSGDLGAGFTNYGLASVDIAAPGVSTLSTVPTGTCALCDASGFKLLSGTSMATPHVSGVLAALLHQRPTLTAAQARDIMLDPASYDVMTDAKAKSTSTGGRLNFPKTLANPRLANPIVLNNFPTLIMGSDVVVNSGSTVNLTANANDADPGDVTGLRFKWDRSISTGTLWLFGWQLGSLFPSPTGSSSSFTAPSIGRVATVPYQAAVADNRGGGAAGQQYVTVNPTANPGGAPTGGLSASTLIPNVGDTVTFNYNPVDPEGGSTAWEVRFAGKGGTSGTCCFTGTAVGATFNSAGVYRVRTQAIDRQLNLSDSPSVVVKVGGATGEPPIASAVLDKLSGPAPLTVNVDMSGSSDPDGTIAYYYIMCQGFGYGSNIPTGSCTYDAPGAYWMTLQVQDNTGQTDIISKYVVVTPVSGGGGGGDTTGPTVSITSPTNNSTVSGTVNLTASATDASGVASVEYHLGSAAGTLIGSAATSPYTVAWNTAPYAGSSQTIFAVAKDTVGNSSTSAGVTVTIPAIVVVRPNAQITSPANGSTVKVKTFVPITATISNAPTYPVSKVDFYVNNTLTCTATTPSAGVYTCSTWKVPAAANKLYTLKTIATDNTGTAGAASTVTVTAK